MHTLSQSIKKTSYQWNVILCRQSQHRSPNQFWKNTQREQVCVNKLDLLRRHTDRKLCVCVWERGKDRSKLVWARIKRMGWKSALLRSQICGCWKENVQRRAWMSVCVCACVRVFLCGFSHGYLQPSYTLGIVWSSHTDDWRKKSKTKMWPKAKCALGKHLFSWQPDIDIRTLRSHSDKNINSLVDL